LLLLLLLLLLPLLLLHTAAVPVMTRAKEVPICVTAAAATAADAAVSVTPAYRCCASYGPRQGGSWPCNLRHIVLIHQQVSNTLSEARHRFATSAAAAVQLGVYSSVTSVQLLSCLVAQVERGIMGKVQLVSRLVPADCDAVC
jgi:hypothetical protein